MVNIWLNLPRYSEKLKDQDVDEPHGKNEGVYSKGGLLHVKKQFLIMRDKEVGGLDVVTT